MFYFKPYSPFFRAKQSYFTNVGQSLPNVVHQAMLMELHHEMGPSRKCLIIANKQNSLQLENNCLRNLQDIVLQGEVFNYKSKEERNMRTKYANINAKDNCRKRCWLIENAIKMNLESAKTVCKVVPASQAGPGNLYPCSIAAQVA